MEKNGKKNAMSVHASGDPPQVMEKVWIGDAWMPRWKLGSVGCDNPNTPYL